MAACRRPPGRWCKELRGEHLRRSRVRLRGGEMSGDVPEWQQVMRGCDRWLGSRRPVRAADRLRAAADALDPSDWPDHYGEGGSWRRSRAGSRTLGAEAAAVFPSGTMAQQVALRIHCDARAADTVAFHPDLPPGAARACGLPAPAPVALRARRRTRSIDHARGPGGAARAIRRAAAGAAPARDRRPSARMGATALTARLGPRARRRDPPRRRPHLGGGAVLLTICG